MSDAVEQTHSARTGIAATAVTLGILLVLAVVLTRTAFATLPLGIPGVWYLLGAVLVVQLARSVRMDDRVRRATAIGVVVGTTVILVGLNPMAHCADTAPPQCGTSFHPVFPILVLGYLLTTVLVFVELDRR